MKRITAYPSFGRHLLKGAAVLVLAASALVPLAAHAEPNSGPSGVPGKSCAVENSDGTVQQVPIGTRIGLAYCGQDGDWHFGWLVDALAVRQPTGPKVPVISAPVGAIAGSA